MDESTNVTVEKRIATTMKSEMTLAANDELGTLSIRNSRRRSLPSGVVGTGNAASMLRFRVIKGTSVRRDELPRSMAVVAPPVLFISNLIQQIIGARKKTFSQTP